ncbi:hypothetical protein B0F90DRAFT_1935362 [Multifurca ochricompacta]|uniref:dual-specificity kinase n=1 Tax=Multifurca ochricompacta TaxID=376703 RepID=A0AAD4M5U8_9AGAM|nr:hypothetical protein B0F90DRAFT_1935362 [Multifurca ochricompacta]
MSSPSPHSSLLTHDKSPSKRKDRPPALEIVNPASASASSSHFSDRHPSMENTKSHVEQLHADQSNDDLHAHLPSRPTSATSSLDPYYFSVHSPSGSPVPPLPDPPHLSKTPETRPVTHEPITPHKDPSKIDRRVLHGLGELATPRWTRSVANREDDQDELEPPLPEEPEEVESDSPWTIEAIDGEDDEERDEPSEVKPIPRAIRTRPSVTEESGGEEILYPRTQFPKPPTFASHSFPPVDVVPPTAFPLLLNKARKRTSDEFERDQTGSLVKKHQRTPSGSILDTLEEHASARKHRSLGVGLPSSSRDKPRERRKDSISTSGSVARERHSRHTSASSSSSSHGEQLHSRRVHTTDFSHLPPSPSTSSIQQFLRHTGSNSAIGAPAPLNLHKEAQNHHTPNVAHSLLRGTQEGWSDLDDQATAEALRKLDGLSGKSGTRVRSSVGSLRPLSSSRPGTPAKSAQQWEGVGSDSGKTSRRSSTHIRDNALFTKDKDQTPSASRQVTGPGDLADTSEQAGSVFGSSDETQLSSPAQDKPPAKKSSTSIRLSYTTTTKRGSASSTTYTSTPTTSSRDSGSMSAGTSLTSVSAQSGRHSTNKTRRNSVGSDVSQSGDVTFLKDRAASLALSSEQPEAGLDVPPVPPLPKDLSTYRPPPQTSAGTLFSIEGVPAEDSAPTEDVEPNRPVPVEVITVPSVSKPPSPPHTSNGDPQGYASAPAVMKTPSKKWSLLGMKLSGSPSVNATKDNSGSKASPVRHSPHSAAFSQPSRRSISKDPAEPWSPVQQPDAMASAVSLASQSSLSSSHALSASGAVAGTPDRHYSSRPGTASSSHKSSSLAAPQQTPLSPSGSIRRGSSKRLTPSAIPFFRRSSSQSVHVSVLRPSSPPASTGPSHLQPREPVSPVDSSLSTPAGAHKKSSIISLGSLLKGSSSRRNLQSGKDDTKSDREGRRARDNDGGKSDKEKAKKEEKDRSESRISVLMGRKRGKTLSSAESKKPQPVSMPPMQISALPQATAQRVANLKATPPSNGSASANRGNTVSSRATSQTISSMQRQSDTSLRSRTQLPTIAGSPSVGTAGSNSQISREMKERDLPPSSSANGSSVNPKETPTKIPRIHSRTSTVSSPALKPSTSSTMASRRTSLIVTSSVAGIDLSPTTGNAPGSGLLGSINNPVPITDEFGVLDSSDVPKATLTTVTQRQSIRASPSSSSASRAPRQVANSTSTSNIPRKGNRESMSFGGLRKSSTSSVASLNSVAPSDAPSTQTPSHRFSALSPSKGLKLLSPKVSLTHSRSSNSSNAHQVATPSSSRLSLSTPSPAPSSVDEEELLGDEEMLQYIKRQQQKKLAHGATQEELDALLRFPEPLPPAPPQSPSTVLKSGQRQHLSEYERQEILDYPSVYYIGAGSEKKLAHPDRPTNNYGYDDDRGDYLVVDRDHLGYRYEVMDSLGKGSFGQVLSCRDHATGESVAIKIIRNKKRFHHQALVEIKILDNLRQWDPEEKHHVIKMTEHFYFRNHLCIAMELLSINLYELIKANGFVGFTTTLIRRFTSQMLMSLTLMRHHRIVHCDLKPENVLLRHPAKSAIKVIDFGSSCFEHEKIYTYIQSRFYRSPEVIMGMNYHMAIDMWSLGCILAELKTGFPIFPGENEQEQLSCIMEVLGLPDKDFVNRSSRKRLFFGTYPRLSYSCGTLFSADSTGAPRPVVNSKGRRRRPGTKTLAQVLRTDDELFVDFVSKCLVWDPERRIKPQNAMRHPFITAGKRSKASTPSSGTAKALLSTASSLTSRSKTTETPKKSQISAPTPLTARISRTTNAQPSTPGGASTSMHSLGSARSYRTSQSQAISSYHSSRTISGFAVR